jgi:hypothetical protein
MKYKRFWMPAVFMGISATVLTFVYFFLPAFFEDDSPGVVLSFIAGYGAWFFILIPLLSLIYTRKIIADNKERFLLTLLNSALIVLPIALWLIAGVDKERLLSVILPFVWCEMWALLGLSGKGDKKSDVWYVPLFISVAVLVVNILIKNIITHTLVIAVLSCVVCPIAIAIYARVCVRDRKSRVFYAVYASLLAFASTFGYTVYSVINKSIDLGDSAWGIIRLVLSAIGTFCLYLLAAFIGAGVKIKLTKRKEKPAPAPENEPEATDEIGEAEAPEEPEVIQGIEDEE